MSPKRGKPNSDSPDRMSSPASNPEGEKNKESIFFGSYRFEVELVIKIEICRYSQGWLNRWTKR